jgi:hypothetical protein
MNASSGKHGIAGTARMPLDLRSPLAMTSRALLGAFSNSLTACPQKHFGVDRGQAREPESKRDGLF